jgi:hypothetical protein
LEEAMPKRRRSVKRQLVSESASEAAERPSATVACAIPIDKPHQVERDVRRELLAQPELRFSSLVVRRVGCGVFCLEGVLETTAQPPDVCSLARRVAGVNQVLNHLVVRCPSATATDSRSN